MNPPRRADGDGISALGREFASLFCIFRTFFFCCCDDGHWQIAQASKLSPVVFFWVMTWLIGWKSLVARQTICPECGCSAGIAAPYGNR